MANEPTQRQITAIHEAGHAVMKWLRGIPATDIHVGDGDGFVAPSFTEVRNEDNLLYTLAGLVAEVAYLDRLNASNELDEYNEQVERHLYLPFAINLEKSQTNDLDIARQILEKALHLRIRLPDNWQEIPTGTEIPVSYFTVEQSLGGWFSRCCEELEPYWQLVETVADAAIVGYLPAADLKAIFEKHLQETTNE
jgi:hypothetical protein